MEIVYRKRIDESGNSSDIWEILSPVPLTMVDRVASQTVTIETTMNGKKARQTAYGDRLNWSGYQAVMDYVLKIAQHASDEQK